MLCLSIFTNKDCFVISCDNHTATFLGETPVRNLIAHLVLTVISEVIEWRRVCEAAGRAVTGWHERKVN